MGDRFERRARWVRLTVWTTTAVALVMIGAVTLSVVHKNRAAALREAAAMAAAPVASSRPEAGIRPVDYDAFERANAARNRAQIARQEADYDAYRSAHKAEAEPPLRRLTETQAP